MVECKLCNRNFGILAESHMKKLHGISCKRYKEMFNLKRGQMNPEHSLRMKGNGNPRFGISLSDEIKEKIRENHISKGIYKGKKNPMYGKTHSPAVRKLISEINKIKMKGSGNSFYGKKHSEITRLSISKSHKESGRFKGKKNPMYGRHHKESTKKRIAKIKRKFLLEHPEKHPTFIMTHRQGKGGYVSVFQRNFFEEIRKHFPDAILNYPIKTRKSLFFADVGIPSIKIDLECDGDYWHRGRIQDSVRDKELRKIGWGTIRISENLANAVKSESILAEHIKSIISEITQRGEI